MLLPRGTSGLGANDKVQLLIISIVFPLLATVAVILRFISRRMKHRRPAALVCFFAYSINLSAQSLLALQLGAYGNSVAEIVGQLDSGSFSRWSPLTMVLGYAIGVIGPNTGLSSGKSKQAIQVSLLSLANSGRSVSKDS